MVPMKKIAPEDRLLTAIKKAEQATQQAKDAALAEEGVTKAQYNALLILKSAPGITSAELARRCFVTPQAMNETVGRLERNGAVTRQRHPTHRHVLEANLTPLGETTLQAADRRVVEVEERLRAALAPADQQTLKDLLATIETAVSAVPPPG